VLPDGARPPVWFAFNEGQPLAFFAGIWVAGWSSVRKLKEGEVTADLYAFLTTEPNREAGAIHPKAMPVILTTQEEIDLWMTAWTEQALSLERPPASRVSRSTTTLAGRMMGCKRRRSSCEGGCVEQ
jgi:putative SOS response-associated peptidase YedK